MPTKQSEINGANVIIANTGVFSITAHHFNVINFVSVISNIIVLPLFSVCYMFLFVFGFIGAITNVFNFRNIVKII